MKNVTITLSEVEAVELRIALSNAAKAVREDADGDVRYGSPKWVALHHTADLLKRVAGTVTDALKD